MGFWKDVALDISRGMLKKDAIKVNATLRDPKATEEEKRKVKTEAEINLKINMMP